MVNSFSIITTVSNPVTRQIGHHRSPVILDRKDEAKWLNDTLPSEEVLKLLKPYNGDEFNAVAVSIKIKDPKNKGRNLIIPVESGNTIEFDSVIKKDLRLEGMGRNKRE